jgi:transposase-like protein
MSPKAQTRKVTGAATKRRAKDRFRCDNCGATFVWQSEKQAHENSKRRSQAIRSTGRPNMAST